MRKILSLLLVLCCLTFSVCSLGISASAEDAYSGACGAGTSDALEWSFDAETGALMVSGTGAMADYATEDGEQAPWYGYRDEIQSVSLPDGLTKIGSYAFRDCANLTAVTIPSSVTFIGASAFLNCGKLTKVVFADADGWYVRESAESVAVPLPAETLADEKQAAECLTDACVGYEWSVDYYGYDLHNKYSVLGIVILVILLLCMIVWSVFALFALIALPFVILSGRRKAKKAKQRQQELEEQRRKALTVLGCVGAAALAVGVISLFRRRK